MFRKHPVYIAFLIVVTIAVLILINRRDGLPGRQSSEFSSGNASLIDKVVISKAEETVILEREEHHWMLNGTAIARNDRVDFLLSCFERIEIVSPAAKSMKDRVAEHLKTEGKLVRLYVNGNLRKGFHVYYEPEGITGTYMMLEDSEDPFMVRLIGYAGNDIEVFFSLNHRSWQDNVLFEQGPDDIREVRLEYPETPEHSFRIRHNETNGVVLSELTAPIPPENTDLHEIQDYLFFFSNIRYEYPEDPFPDSLISGSPFADLTVITGTGREIHLKAYRWPVSDNASEAYDLNRFIGLINDDRDTVILEYADMDPVLRRIEDFQKK
ncbi:MAG: hypothetical protein JXA61_05235 [Bacteroidales bacterium]|nr:hypothetical protein [Bacteroidales bacterium]